MRNTNDRYGPVARGLHWTMSLLLIVQVIGAVYVFEFMERSAERVALIGVHKALGVVLRRARERCGPGSAVVSGGIDTQLVVYPWRTSTVRRRSSATT